MNFVILHGTPNNIEKGSICDDGVYITLLEGDRLGTWNYRKSMTEEAECVLEDGNYFNEEDGGIGTNWTDERKKFVHDKWLALIDIIDKQLEERGRFDIEFFNYFADKNDKTYKELLKEKISKFLADVENDKANANIIVDIMEDLEEKY